MREPNTAAARLLDRTFTCPEENLAYDEALLRAAEERFAAPESCAQCEYIRFWESPAHFVVLGVAGRFHEEADVPACRRDGIPILRRASGGGTVLQGPGCLNFSLVLSLARRPELRDLTASYRSILTTVADRLGDLSLSPAQLDPSVALAGTSDLILGDRKISGNAQKRTRHALLHHGTILYDFDLELVERYLKPPPRSPEYRRSRTHRDFCRNVPLPVDTIKGRIAAAWTTQSPDDGVASVDFDLDELIREKYGARSWTERF